jgi:hypothetical protein
MLTAFGEIWMDTIWLNDQMVTYTYNRFSRPVTKTVEDWLSGNWEYTYMETYTYDAAGNMLTMLGQNRDNDAWINDLKMEYTYNAYDRMTNCLQKNWENPNWVNNRNCGYNYNSYGGVESATETVWTGNEWQNNNLTSHTYDEDGNALEGDYYIWDNDSWAQLTDGVISMPYNYCTINEDEFVGYHIEGSYTSLIVGISEAEMNKPTGFYLLPNPARLSTTIHLLNSVDKKCSITLYKLNGEKVREINTGSLSGRNFIILSTPELCNGIYFVVMDTGNDRITRKLVIRK